MTGQRPGAELKRAHWLTETRALFIALEAAQAPPPRGSSVGSQASGDAHAQPPSARNRLPPGPTDRRRIPRMLDILGTHAGLR